MFKEKKSNTVKTKQINSKNIKYLNYTNNLTELIYKADVDIIGEGLIKYESAILKTPSLIIHQNDNNSYMINKFLNLKTCTSLGLYKKVNQKELKKQIISYLKNFNLMLKNYKNAKKYFLIKKND